MRFSTNVDRLVATRLDAIDLNTGTVQTLLDGDKIDVYLDLSRTRLAYVAQHWNQDGTSGELWAGAVPQP